LRTGKFQVKDEHLSNVTPIVYHFTTFLERTFNGCYAFAGRLIMFIHRSLKSDEYRVVRFREPFLVSPYGNSKLYRY
jgi:hypothetical protein